MSKIILLTSTFLIAFIYFISFVPGLYTTNFLFLPIVVWNFALILVQGFLIERRKPYLIKFTSANLVFSVFSVLPILGNLFLLLGILTNLIIASFECVGFYSKMIGLNTKISKK